MLPFNNIPRQLKIKFIYFIVLWLNLFLAKNGILAVYSPRKLLIQWQLYYAKQCWVLLVIYCEIRNMPLPSNTMVTRMHKAIAMGPTGNLRASAKLFCIHTRHILKQCSFTPQPMPDRVIKRINKIGVNKKQGCTCWFVNCNKEHFKWTDDIPEKDEVGMAPYPHVSTEIKGVCVFLASGYDWATVSA
jgi:hypothetical protein